MEELLAKTNKLHVSDEEEWEVDHSLSTMIAKYNLRGRLCSKVDHSRGFLKNLLGRIWRLKESEWNIKIQEKVSTGMFLTFSFNSEQTQSRILARMPWYLSNGVLILGKMGNSSESWKNDLNVFPIWGRALGVPIDYPTEKNTSRLASMAGNHRGEWHDGNGAWNMANLQGGIRQSLNLCMGNSFDPLLNEGDEHVQLRSEVTKGTEQHHGNKDISKLQNTTTEKPQQEQTGLETHDMLQDGRGKRRLVEDREVVGAGKLQRTANNPMVMNESQTLIDVPIGFSMDIPGLKESLPFAFGSDNLIFERLDRACGNSDWFDMFPAAKVFHLERINSDHCPLLLTCAKQQLDGVKGVRWHSRFHFEHAWVEEETCVELVTKSLSSLFNTKEDWNETILNKYFHKEDVPWILGIPIDNHSEDILVWPFTKDGHYIVKIGYRVAREINLAPTRCSNMDQTHAWWKMWWNLNLPPRMKLFGWKMCRNWLPAKSNLCHRGTKIDPTCNNCGRFEESLSHALWTCDKVKKVWKLLPYYKLIKESRRHSMMDLLVEFRQKLAREEFEDVIKVFSSYPRDISGKESLPTVHSAAPKDQWPAPPVGTYCVHCDAAIQPNQVGVGLGYIWRDWSGNIVSAGMHYLPVCCTVPVAEAKAVVAALQDRPKNMHNPYEIKSDCKQLVDKISGNDSFLGDIQPIVNQIKRHPSFSFVQSSFM
ncbi:hypothetical protein F8388_013127 [Cannabis sativa]|uniref:Reverse transcriptase zinc-binding domain-containing protein n=1 Tax=Cannabis sativa TaxID=3483 RepID=A0A7J6HMS9_CANSA|nr:hypothetical protein F8388_013127 [Cannabis sativa]